MFEDISEFTKNRYRYISAFKEPKRFDRLYRETYQDRFAFCRLNSKVLERIYRNPDVVPRMEEFLLGTYAKALEFCDWRLVPDGLVITGAGNAMYTALRDAQTFGNDALGIDIGKNILYEVPLYMDPKDYRKLETMFTSLFAHELTQFHRMDNYEVSNFAISLLFDPSTNAYLELLRNDVDGWIRLEKHLPDRDALRHVNAYEIQRYIGLVLAANQFAKTNDAIRRLFEKDRSPNKLRATRDFMKLI